MTCFPGGAGNPARGMLRVLLPIPPSLPGIMSAHSTVPAVSFETSLEVVERIVHELEEGQLGLSESLAKYEEGVRHLRRCHELLVRAERKIETLTGVDSDGEPRVTPYLDEVPSLEAKQAARSQRRQAAQTEAPADPDDDLLF